MHYNSYMNKPKISLIAAISEKQGALGFKNQLLWKIEGDLPRFKALTSGHPIIMGRNTYLSIGKPLPQRKNIVISHTGKEGLPSENEIIVVSTLEEAFEEARKTESEEIFVVGGGMVYTSAIKFADRLYLTIVYNEPEADTFFPDYSDFKNLISKEDHLDKNPPFSYLILEK
jgi:dihydrofolate reductase